MMAFPASRSGPDFGIVVDKIAYRRQINNQGVAAAGYQLAAGADTDPMAEGTLPLAEDTLPAHT